MATKFTKLQLRKAELNVLEKLMNSLDSYERDYLMSYEEVGKETEQATDWRTGELRWEDDEKTIPYYKSIYDYVPRPEEKWTVEDYATQKAVENIRAVLEKMI